jgi:glycosyltransferase involved in cell wall biosynthesis
MKKVSIIIPARNEEKRIDGTVTDYLAYFNNLKKNKVLDYELIIVLNACTDNSREVLEKFKGSNMRVLDFQTGGKGFAITEGFKDAINNGSDLIGFIDADGATPPGAFYKMVEEIGEYDGIIGDRWHKQSIVAKQTFFRRFLSRGYNFIVRSLFLLPYRDTQCGAKLFKRPVLEKNIHKMISSQWNFDLALLFCLKKESNAKIKSIPTKWIDKEASKVNIKRTPVTMFASAIRLRLMHFPFKFIVRAYRKLPNKFKFH